MKTTEARAIVRNWFGDQLERISKPNGFLTPTLFVWRHGYRGFKTFDERTGYPNVCVVLGDTPPSGRTGNVSAYKVNQAVHLQLVCRDAENPPFRDPELEQQADDLYEDVCRAILANPKIPGLVDATFVRWVDEGYEPTSTEYALRMLDFELDYYVDHA